MKNLERLLLSAVAVTPLMLGCGGDDNGTGQAGSAGAGAAGTSGVGGAAGNGVGGSGGVSDASSDVSVDAALTDAADAGDASVVAFIRVANLSPGAPAIDFCLRPRAAVDSGTEAGGSDAGDAESGAEASEDGATTDADAGISDAADAEADATDSGASGFSIGPVFKGLGLTAGLSYGQVSSYAPVASGSYDVRVVAANAPNCNVSLADLPDTTTLPAFVTGTYSTVAAIGLIGADVGPSFELRAYGDERTVTAGSAKVRFIHASPLTPNVDVGEGTGESFVPIFVNVPYGGVGVGTGVDTSGYFTLPPVSNQTLVVRLNGTSVDAVVAPGFSLASGQIASVFAIGVASSATTPLQTLTCLDLDNTKAPLSNCSVQPSPGDD